MAIGFIGAGAQAISTTSGATITAAYPTGYTAVANDVCIVVCGGKHTNGTTLAPSAPTPATYTQANTIFHELGAVDQQLTVWYKKLTAAEAAPSTTVPAAYSGTTAGISIQCAIYSGVDTTTQMDATAVTSTGAAAATFTPTGITTATAGAWVVSCVLTADDNALDFNPAGNPFTYSLRMGGANYDWTTGGDNAIGVADAQFNSTGAQTCPTWRESLVGNDAWCSVTVALRPASYTGIIPGPHVITQTAVNMGSVY